MESSDWIKEIVSVFSLKTLTPVQIRSVRPDRLVKMARRIESFERSCPQCRDHKKELNQTLVPFKENSELTDEALHAYLNMFRNLLDHLKTEHKLVYPGHYAALYTLPGMVLGAAFWLSLRWIYNEISVINLPLKMGLLVSLFIGLAIGRYLGHIKDKKYIQADKKLY